MEALQVLKKYYGYDTFRKGQEELIDPILHGQDVVGILPTGGGKSLCYQIPALLMDGVTLVISPLISLMKDQVDTLKENGIAAELLNSTLSSSAYQAILDKAREGAYKLLYIAPERLELESFMALTEQIHISFVAIDEAHCVSQWGHDFRPSYTRIAQMINRLPHRPVIGAYTATATPIVREDIKQLLRLQAPYEFMGSFDRENLYFEVRKPQDKVQEMKSYIEMHQGESGIIYCATRKTVEEVCDRLNAKGIAATKYHAGLTDDARAQNQDDFLYDRVPIMVATNAFGMGIDKPNVRFVIHFNMPRNMESYYQEAGRAGRDGAPAQCLLLFSTQDIMTNRFLIENGNTLGLDKSGEYEKLSAMVDYCHKESCLRNYILSYFGQVPSEEACGHCSSCNNEIEATDMTVEAQKIMSCVKRMNEQFGSGLVVDVLKGAKTQKIKDLRFWELRTYGIMRDYSKDAIKEMIAFLVAEGYLALVGAQYPILRLTPLSYEVLKGETQVVMKRVILKETRKPISNLEEVEISEDLYNRLKEERKQLAMEHGVQPFMIVSDTTLKDMCLKYPVTDERMLQVSGIGEYKLASYGERFRHIVVQYVEEYKIPLPDLDAMKEVKKSTSKASHKGSVGDSHRVSYEMYLSGVSIEEIAKQRNMAITTVEGHLVRCIEEGLEIDYSDFIPADAESLIMEAIERCGVGLLKPIKEALPEEISYRAIKFAVCKIKMQ